MSTLSIVATLASLGLTTDTAIDALLKEGNVRMAFVVAGAVPVISEDMSPTDRMAAERSWTLVQKILDHVVSTVTSNSKKPRRRYPRRGELLKKITVDIATFQRLCQDTNISMDAVAEAYGTTGGTIRLYAKRFGFYVQRPVGRPSSEKVAARAASPTT